MNEDKYRAREARLKILNTMIAAIGTLAVIGSIWIGLKSVAASSQAQATAINDQWGQRFYDERLLIYARATEAASRIAALTTFGGSKLELKDARLEFQVLYWGPMCITEGVDMEAAMVIFGDALDKSMDGPTLEYLAQRLAHVARNEMHATFPGVDSSVSKFGDSEEILRDMHTKLGQGTDAQDDTKGGR